MLLLAENKRRVLAGCLAILVVLAVGVAIGRLTAGSPAAAQAATFRPAQGRQITALRAELAAARSSATAANSSASAADTQLRTVRTENETLRHGTSERTKVLARCLYRRHVGRCVEGALR
jgi:hypothetical protein